MVSTPDLTLNTKSNVVTEGVNLSLNCSVQQGTFPITFTWYRTGVVKPLNKIQISKKQGIYTIKSITRDDEGLYYCRASNDANETRSSDNVKIKGHNSPSLCCTINVFLGYKTSQDRLG